MKRAPLVDESQGFRRQKTFVNLTGLDLNERFVFAVDGVEMSGRMVAVVEPDDDALEAADFRHGPVPGSTGL